MTRTARSRPMTQGEPGVVVTVVRGHTAEETRVFKFGEDSGRMSVGSRGDWCVSGPGVMNAHLWLSFDGAQLLAASGEGAAFLQGKPLGHGWSPVQDRAELRFGFALLRVTREGAHGTSGLTKRPDPTRLIVGIAAGLLFTVVLVAALLLRRGSTQPPSAEPSVSVAAAAASAPLAPLPAVPAALGPPSIARSVQPAREEALPAPALVQASPVAAGVAPEALAATFKPPSPYPQNVANKPVPQLGDKPWLISEPWRAHHERHLRALGRATAKVIFLGDSITEGWSVAPAYREQFGKYSPLNFGIANDTTQNVLWRVEHGALDGTHPEVVVLMVGINNLAGGFTPEQTADGVRAVVTAIQAHAPSARVLLLGVLPARQDAGNPLRQAIKDANRLLQGLAQPGKVELHDVGSVMLEQDGSILKSTMRDFVHPTADGFERLSQAIAPFLEALMPAPTQ